MVSNVTSPTSIRFIFVLRICYRKYFFFVIGLLPRIQIITYLGGLVSSCAIFSSTVLLVDTSASYSLQSRFISLLRRRRLNSCRILASPVTPLSLSTSKASFSVFIEFKSSFKSDILEINYRYKILSYNTLHRNKHVVLYKLVFNRFTRS